MTTKINSFLLISISIFIQYNITYAQTTQILPVSKKMKLRGIDDSKIDYFIGRDNEGFFIARHYYYYDGIMKNKKYIIEKFNINTFEKIWDLELKPKWLKEDINDIFIIKDKIVVLSTFYETNKTHLYKVQLISFNGELLYSEPKQIVKIEREAKGVANAYFSPLSPDSSKLLIAEIIRDDKEPEEMEVFVLSTDNFSTIWRKKMPNTYNGINIHTYDYLVDNNGNMLFLFIYQTNGKVHNAFGNLNMDGTLQVTELRLDNNKISNRDMFARKKRYVELLGLKMMDFYNEITWNFADNDNLCIAGFFRDAGQTGKAGVFQYIVNKNSMKIVRKQEKYFDNKTEQRFKEFDKDGISGIELNPIKLVKAGNTFYLFGLPKKFDRVGDKGILDFKYDFLLCKLSKNSIEWTLFLPQDGNYGSSSIIYSPLLPIYQSNNNIYFMYAIYSIKEKEKEYLQQSELSKFNNTIGLLEGKVTSLKTKKLFITLDGNGIKDAKLLVNEKNKAAFCTVDIDFSNFIIDNSLIIATNDFDYFQFFKLNIQ